MASSAQAQHTTLDKQFVDMLVDPYLQIQQGLADDDFPTTKSGASDFLKATKHAHPIGDEKVEIDGLARPALSISTASEIAFAREEFQDLSLRMKVLIKRVGTSGDTPLYVAKCPMAFGGQGGIWIQNDTQITNPYFGSKMYRCGGVQEQISGGEADSSKADGEHQGTGHDHGAMVEPAVDNNLANLDSVHSGVPEYHSAMGHSSMTASGEKKVTEETCKMARCAN